MLTVRVDGVAQRVQHKRERAEEDNERYDAGVEQLLRREDVCQLRKGSTLSVWWSDSRCCNKLANSKRLYLVECFVNIADNKTELFVVSTSNGSPGMHCSTGASPHLCVQHCEADSHRQVHPRLQERDDLGAAAGRSNHKHILHAKASSAPCAPAWRQAARQQRCWCVLSVPAHTAHRETNPSGTAHQVRPHGARGRRGLTLVSRRMV